MLRLQMKEFVDHLCDVLAPSDGSGPKRFQKTTVTKLTDFIDNFALKNVTNDTGLEQVLGHAKAILNGVDADSLRNDDTVREYVVKGLGIVKECLSALTEDAGTRKIVLSEEEEV